MKKGNHQKPARFGSVIGLAPGDVPVYSSDYDSVDDREMPDRHSFRSYLNGMPIGYKWQCVEFARRWLYLNLGYIFDDVPMAYDIFGLRTVRRIADGGELPLRSFRNGAKRPPEPGCLLIWGEGGEFEMTGHVAIVTEVTPHFVRLVEQNFDNLPWPEGQTYSRELKAFQAQDGEYWIQCSLKGAAMLGWVIQTDDDTWSEVIVDVNRKRFDLILKEIADPFQVGGSWLNMANEDEAAYVACMGGHKLASRDEDRFKYWGLSKTAQQEIRRAAGELHALFMRTTDHILQHDALLAKFNLPRAVWPRIRQSWNNRRNQMITGRFDFAVSAEGIKVYEYNADSAACYLECAKIQGRWAQHYGCTDGYDPGKHLIASLVKAWENSEVDGVLHVMQDQEPEETYHALFMKSVMEQAGIHCKTIRGVNGLAWNRHGQVVDADGIEIRWVWKTWAWETAVDQLREECEADDAGGDYPFDTIRNHAPRLVDVLLNKAVMVFEPLWTLIPSNKAILPIMWSEFPNHRYLLDTQFALTEALQQQGYVIKPIAGRCGCNISLIDARNAVLDETNGRFRHQDQIYQALHRLPLIDGYHVQVSAFSAAGRYAGCCVRVDPAPVIKQDSDVMPLRILEDTGF